MDVNATVETSAKVIEFIKTYAPWLIVLLLTQAVKLAFLKVLVDWLKRVLTWVVPFFISALVWLIFSLPAPDVAIWLQNSLTAWVLSVFGYDGLKALIGMAKGIIAMVKGPSAGGKGGGQ